MAIDLAVSRAVTRIHALERAVHDSGHWTMELAGRVVPAQRTITEDGVSFVATFPADAHGIAVLLVGGEHVWTVGFVAPSEKSFELTFELTLPVGIAA
jgi:hypothetical protein